MMMRKNSLQDDSDPWLDTDRFSPSYVWLRISVLLFLPHLFIIFLFFSSHPYLSISLPLVFVSIIFSWLMLLLIISFLSFCFFFSIIRFGSCSFTPHVLPSFALFLTWSTRYTWWSRGKKNRDGYKRRKQHKKQKGRNGEEERSWEKKSSSCDLFFFILVPFCFFVSPSPSRHPFVLQSSHPSFHTLSCPPLIRSSLPSVKEHWTRKDQRKASKMVRHDRRRGWPNSKRNQSQDPSDHKIISWCEKRGTGGQEERMLNDAWEWEIVMTSHIRMVGVIVEILILEYSIQVQEDIHISTRGGERLKWYNV